MKEQKGTIIEASAAPSASADGKRSYERSTIEFPYNDLDEAVGVVKTIHQNAGTECDLDALAAYMKQSMTSGTFRGRVANAGTFRLTENDRGKVRLTELGRMILNAEQETQARVESFLSVPLYQKLYERYKGYTLPPSAAFEREIIALGVASKQTDKARQAFMRSARQAGFFDHGEDRLIKPQLTPIPTTKPIEPPRPEMDAGGRGGGSGGGGKPPIDQLIKGLVDRLPPSDTVWALRDRAKWLQTAMNAFDLIYKSEDAEEGEIAISLRRSPS